MRAPLHELRARHVSAVALGSVGRRLQAGRRAGSARRREGEQRKYTEIRRIQRSRAHSAQVSQLLPLQVTHTET